MGLQSKKASGFVVWSCSLLKFGIFILMSSLTIAKTSYELIDKPVFMCGSGLEDKSETKDVIFESVPSRPLALSDDGSLLYVINAHDNCLEIYVQEDDGLNLVSSVAVGIGPVSVAERTKSEIWVVNHISDSVSVISIDGRPHIKNTLQVGDEPWDIVFTNAKNHDLPITKNTKRRAFVSATYRGQSHPQFKTEFLLLNRLDADKGGQKGELIGRADLWVFDMESDGAVNLAGIINTFTTSIRSLAVDQLGTKVFATAFKSGNRTAITPVPLDGLLGDKWSADGVGHLEPFAIVQQQGGKWLDASGANWPDYMNFDVADNDVFVINALASLELGTPDTPKYNRQAILETVESVGSVLFNSFYDEASNSLFVSTVDAINTVPMEHNVKGIFTSNHIKVVDFNESPAKVSSINLDSIYQGVGEKAGYALPSGLIVTPSTGDVYVTSMGTNQISSFNVDAVLKGGPVQSLNLNSVVVEKGPIAIVAGRDAKEFYSYSYISNSVTQLFKTKQGVKQQSKAILFNPELEDIQKGRLALYDATITSNNNRVACASCHIFGGEDHLQWNLSTTGKNVLINKLSFIEHEGRQTAPRSIRLKIKGSDTKVGDLIPIGDMGVEVKYIGDQAGFAESIESGDIAIDKPGLVYLEESQHDPRLTRYKVLTGKPTWVIIETPFLHPLKGPMRTTPLHGIADSGPMHFLGDKFGLVSNLDGPCSDVNGTQAERAFKEFNSPCDGSPGPFETLLGGPHLDDKLMNQLTKFSLALTFPPNPIRPLNNQVNEKGEKIFNSKIGVDLANWDHVRQKSPLVFSCSDCHTTNKYSKLFGTSQQMYSAPPLSLQDAKVPHLRYLYDRAGFLRGDYRRQSSDFLNMRKNDKYFDTVVHAQGLNHGGWFDFSMFFADMVWIVDESQPVAWSPSSKEKYGNLFRFLMEFDTNYLPMYGRQITISKDFLSDNNFKKKLSVYIDDALRPESNQGNSQCDVVVAGENNRNNIKHVNDVIAISKSSDFPLTLMCI
ncbi:YncE family protein [Dasania marina]|uniref:YncE family protein n=1 Tax=Dasania marina TaxID=471499 RepID=UPI000364A08F|nr:hypothetical protein [Dasania marina]